MTEATTPITEEEFRKTIKVTEEKTGKGDKQETVWYIRDRDDPKGERGSQSTVTAKAAVDWDIGHRYRSYLLRWQRENPTN